MIRKTLWLTVLAAALVGDRAYAISTLEDVISNAPRIVISPYRSPSSNTVLRNLSRPQSGIAPNSSLLRAGTADEGPALDEPLQTVPAQVAPWMVALSEGDDLKTGFACGGVLVAPDWVLSAAHCAFHWMQRWPVDFKPYAFTETAEIGKPGKRFPIAEIVPHPGYDPETLQNDLVLLRLDIRDQQPSTPIRIEGPPIATQGGNVITLLGWGLTTNFSDEQHSQRLQLLQFAILDDAVCFSAIAFSETAQCQCLLRPFSHQISLRVFPLRRQSIGPLRHQCAALSRGPGCMARGLPERRTRAKPVPGYSALRPVDKIRNRP